MTDRTYNGWTNYATWRVNLEIFYGMAARDLTGARLSVSELRDAAQAYAEEIIEQSSTEGLARDYALAFLSDVDWWSIANNLLADEAQDEDEDEDELAA
jgi:hypothetical protein